MAQINVQWQRATLEFLAIVIGVLVALAVDQWWTDREERRMERDYIIRIIDDLKSDIENFERLERIFETKAITAQQLRDYPDSELITRSPSDIVQDLVFSGYVALPDSTSTTFDELVSTGRFALISSVEQRDALSRYYSGFEHISGIMFAPAGDYKKVLWESFPAEFLIRGRLSDVSVTEREVIDGIKQLTADPRLKAAANSEMVYAESLIFYLSGYRNDAEVLVNLLSGEPAPQ